MKILSFLALWLSALVMGVFWGTWFTLSRSIEVFNPDAFLAIGKNIIANVAWPMRILMPCTILCIILALWCYPNKRSVKFYLGVGGLVLMIVTLLITVLIEVPIDNMIREWTVDTIPATWEQERDTWEYFHSIRTFTSVSSLGLLLWAFLD